MHDLGVKTIPPSPQGPTTWKVKVRLRSLNKIFMYKIKFLYRRFAARPYLPVLNSNPMKMGLETWNQETNYIIIKKQWTNTRFGWSITHDFSNLKR